MDGQPMPEVLRTARLRLEAVGTADGDRVHLLLGDPATNTLTDGPFTDSTQSAEWARRRASIRATIGLSWYLLIDLDHSEVVGSCGIFPGRTGPSQPEIGYMIRRGRQGEGLATEAIAAVVAACHAAGPRRIWATVRPSNLASLAVAHCCGFVDDRFEADEHGDLLYLVHSSPRPTREPSARLF